ncbi:MAG: hypothetical protein ACRC0B_07710 [Legionella sp.]
MNFYCSSLLCLGLLVQSPSFCADSPLQSAVTTLPASAFWVKNHWPQQDSYSAPHQWRSAKELSTLTASQLNLQGLAHLNISGSSPLTEQNMQWLKHNYSHNQVVYLIDLRQETHLYVNSLPISLFYQKDQINWGKSLNYINESEQIWAKTLAKKGYIILNQLGKPQKQIKIAKSPQHITIHKIQLEEELAVQNGFVYFRIAVPDYLPPSPAQVDEFVSIMRNRPNNTWVHVHCAGGKGRTTTFMVMSDILVNAPRLSLNDIILRQAQQGGINLLTPSKSLSTQGWKKNFHHAREQFIHLFYQYIHSGAHHQQSFEEWLKNQPMNTYKLILKTTAYEQ